MPPLTQGSTLDVDEATGSIVSAFRAAEDELRAELERVVEIVALDPTSTKRYREAQVRGLLGRVATLRADLEGQASLFASEGLGRVYTTGMRSANELLGLAGQPEFTLLHREALDVLAVDTFDDLADATTYLEASTKRTIREATKLRTIVGSATGAGVGRDTNALVRALERGGVSGFVDAAGRSWRLSTYAEMVVRTKSAHAYNTGRVLRAEETGTRVFEIYDGERSGHDACLAYNRRTCTSTWAVANPVLHPNCVRGFGPLPLHRGGVDYGVLEEDGPAADSVLAESDRREAAAIERLHRADLTSSDGVDLSGLPVGRSFRMDRTGARPKIHGGAEAGPGTARVNRGRLTYVEDDAIVGVFENADDALDAIEARLAAAIPDGLDDSVRAVVYTAKRNPADERWSERYGGVPFTSAGTSSGRGIVLWRRRPVSTVDRWLDGEVIDHEAGHSIMHEINRRAADAAAKRQAAAAETILDDAPEWLAEVIDRLGLDPLEVPMASLQQLGETEVAKRVSRLLGEGGTVGPATPLRLHREIDREIESFLNRRQEIRSIGADYVGPSGEFSGAVPGRGFLQAGADDAERLGKIVARYERLAAESRAGKRKRSVPRRISEGGSGEFRPVVSDRVRREIRLATTVEDNVDLHPITLDGTGRFANQPARPAVTDYGASVEGGVEDWAETWRLWQIQQRNGRIGTDDYTGRDVTFDDLWPNRSAWVREAFDLIGLEPS